MNAVSTEFTKLSRSLSQVVVLLLPIAMVLTGTMMTLIDGRGLEDGWHTLWMRSIVFYGLFPLAVGIAILASLVWRIEHRGSNWNALMAGPTSSRTIVMAKTAVIAVMAAIMQLVALATTVAMGLFTFQLPGFLPLRYLGISALIMIAQVPVAALSSWLSMQIRSFAIPVAIAFLGAGFSTFLLVVGLDAAIAISPYATLSRATQLGTATFADTGEVTAGIVAAIIVASTVLSAVITTIHTLCLERSDIHT